MQVVGEHDHGVDLKRPRLLDFAQGIPEHLNARVVDKNPPAPPSDDGKEITATSDTQALIVAHELLGWWMR